jgi:hypothetical protein
MIDFEALSRAVEGIYAMHGRLREYAHIERVAAMTRVSGDRATAYLHDVVEDGLLTLPMVRTTLYTVGAVDDSANSVLRAVATLTRRPFESYREYIDRIVASDDRTAMRVKQLDLFDHLSPYTRHTLEREKAERYVGALELLVKASLPWIDPDVSGTAQSR